MKEYRLGRFDTAIANILSKPNEAQNEKIELKDVSPYSAPLYFDMKAMKLHGT